MEEMTVLEKVTQGLGVSVLGMVTVFAGLLILICVITLLSRATTANGSKKKTETQSAVPAKAADVPDDVMAVIAAALAMNDQCASNEEVAAIAAALNVVMGEGRFVVRHVKRIHNAPAWNRAGREEQIYSRF